MKKKFFRIVVLIVVLVASFMLGRELAPGTQRLNAVQEELDLTRETLEMTLADLVEPASERTDTEQEKLSSTRRYLQKALTALREAQSTNDSLMYVNLQKDIEINELEAACSKYDSLAHVSLRIMEEKDSLLFLAIKRKDSLTYANLQLETACAKYHSLALVSLRIMHEKDSLLFLAIEHNDNLVNEATMRIDSLKQENNRLSEESANRLKMADAYIFERDSLMRLLKKERRQQKRK